MAPPNPLPAAPPPRPDWVSRALLLWTSRDALPRTPRWLLTRGAPVLLVCAALFALNGLLLGWDTAYDVLIGITSPAQVRPAWCAWPLSLTGWALLPALIGGLVGYVVATQIDAHRTRALDEILAELRAEAAPEAGEGD